MWLARGLFENQTTPKQKKNLCAFDAILLILASRQSAPQKFLRTLPIFRQIALGTIEERGAQINAGLDKGSIRFAQGGEDGSVQRNLLLQRRREIRARLLGVGAGQGVVQSRPLFRFGCAIERSDRLLEIFHPLTPILLGIAERAKPIQGREQSGEIRFVREGGFQMNDRFFALRTAGGRNSSPANCQACI